MSETTREKNHRLLLEYLSTKSCKDCGRDDLRCLNFDHLPKFKKTDTVSSLIHKGHPWSRVMKEINKTEVVCLSCHQIRSDVRASSRRQIFWEELQRRKNNEDT